MRSTKKRWMVDPSGRDLCRFSAKDGTSRVHTLGPLGLAFMAPLPLFLAGCSYGAFLTAFGIAKANEDEKPSPPTVTSVSPVRVQNDRSFRLTILGERFAAPCHVCLEFPGGSLAEESLVVSPSSIEATFAPSGNFASFAGVAAVCVDVGGRIGRWASELHVSHGKPLLAGACYTTVQDPRHMVALDYDGDGRSDLAVATGSEQMVQFFQGAGDGTFVSGEFVVVGSAALWLAAVPGPAVQKVDLGDPAGDALVVVTETDVQILYKESSHDPFIAKQISPLEKTEGNRRVVAGNFDNDTDGYRDDLVIATEDDEDLYVLWDLGQEGAEFFASQLGYVNGIAVADFDGKDGEDIVTISKRRGKADFHLSKGATKEFVLALSRNEPSGPRVVAAGNLYDPVIGDEYPDIVMAKAVDEVAFTHIRGLVPGAAKPKLAYVKGKRSASVGRGACAMLFVDVGGPKRRDPRDRAMFVSVPDLIVANYDSGDVSIAITPDADLGDSRTVPVMGSPKALAAIDDDGDAVCEMIAVLSADRTTSTGPGWITILRQRPDRDPDGVGNPFAIPYSSEPVYRPSLVGIEQVGFDREEEIATADLDRDGWPDYAIACRETDEVAVVLSHGGAYDLIDFFPTGSAGTRFVRVADMDQDGFFDLVTTNRIGCDVSVLYSSGTPIPRFDAKDVFHLKGVVGSENGIEKPQRLQTFAVGDLDGDTRPDAAVAVTLADQVIFLWNRDPGQTAGTGRDRVPVPSEGEGRLRFEAERYDGISADPRWAEANDFDHDGLIDVLIGCSSRKRPDGSLVKNGGLTIFRNRGAGNFELFRILPWGPLCHDSGYRDPAELVADETQFVTCAYLEQPFPFEQGGFKNIVTTGAETLNYYSPPDFELAAFDSIGERHEKSNSPWGLYSERDKPLYVNPRWVPIEPLDKYEGCSNEDGWCIDPNTDSEYVLPFDVNGDGWVDLISIDEERASVYVLLNNGKPEDDSFPCRSERFELVDKFESQSPQGVQAFKIPDGATYLATIHRGDAKLTLHRWDNVRERFGLWKDIPLHRSGRGGRYGVAARKGFACFIREERALVQVLGVDRLVAGPGGANPWLGAWEPDHGAISLRVAGRGTIPQAVALGSWTSGAAKEAAFDLAIAATEPGSESSSRKPILYVLPPLTDAQLPAAKTWLPLETVVQGSGSLREILMPAGERWIALIAADAGSPLGEIDGRCDLVAVTDGGVWVLFGQERGGLGEPVQVLSPAEGEVILDAALGRLDSDSAPDLAITTALHTTYRVSVGYGPFGDDSSRIAWADAPLAGSIPACCGIGSIADRGKELGILVVAEKSGAAKLLTADNRAQVLLYRESYVGLDPVDISFGDLNSDKLPDIIVANGSPGTLTVLVGEGEGTVSKLEERYPVYGEAEAVRVLDLDGVGADDVLVGNGGPGLYVGLNQTTNRLSKSAKD
jgi:hypothetical protein